MTRHLLILFLLPLLSASAEPLALKEAVQQALHKNPSMEAAAARIQAAGSRVEQAKSGRLPQLHLNENFMSGNNPVYVFGALLTQKQFGVENFNIQSLNSPAPLNNFQTQAVADQLVYDFGALKNQVKAAELGQKISEQERRGAELALIAGVARSYYSVTLASQALDVAREALKAAEADQNRSRNLLAAGMATDADVLSISVHAAAMREQVIRRQADLEVARAALNDALGLPLDTPHDLSSPLVPVEAAKGGAEQAVQSRPELLGMRLAKEVANAQAAGARAAYWPQFGLRGVFETDAQQFVNKGGGNWMVMASMKWVLFDGKRTREAVSEAGHLAAAAAASERQYDSAIRLQVLKAQSDFHAATERIRVTEASIAEAEESLRIVRNRYSSGMANVTDLLRSQSALLDARTRRLAAVYDQRVAAVAVEQAAGILNGDSNVLE